MLSSFANGVKASTTASQFVSVVVPMPGCIVKLRRFCFSAYRDSASCIRAGLLPEYKLNPGKVNDVLNMPGKMIAPEVKDSR